MNDTYTEGFNGGFAYRDNELESLRAQIEELKAENERLNTMVNHAKQMNELDTSERDELKRQLNAGKAGHELELEQYVEKCTVRIAELKRQRDELIAAIDEHLVVSHIGVFNLGDDPKAALNKIACYEQGVGDYFGKEDLRKERDEYKAAAERYLWLRENGNANSKKSSKAIGYTDATRLKASFSFSYFAEDIDAAIDAARAAMKEIKE